MPSLIVLLGVCLALLPCLRPSAHAVEPLPRAHAHNDYEHTRPLLDALAHGFCSVEADIHLVDGQLLVAHDRDQVQADRTLQALYLEPLQRRIRAHKGRVYPDGPAGFTLLVDIKSAAEPTYVVLEPLLEEYADMLTAYTDHQVRTGAVSVILSGNRPWTQVASRPLRRVGIDGRLPDLERSPPPGLVPLVSDHWGRHFAWRGEGPFPEVQRARLRDWVQKAHAQHRRLRFWAVPDRPAAWKVLHDAGVDLINTDQLGRLAEFLSGTAAP